jgi:hypothetical protein
MGERRVSPWDARPQLVLTVLVYVRWSLLLLSGLAMQFH